MIILRADNRVLNENAPYSYLVDNEAAGASTLTIVNPSSFAVDDFILVEEFGKEKAEIFRAGAINTSTGVITLEDKDGSATTTNFAHPESTKVYQIDYNQVRFYWTAAAGDITDEDPTYDTDNPLGAAQDIDPTSWYSTFEDANNSTGFGWFIFYNSITAGFTENSNPIPYLGFAGNTVAQVFEDFDSLLNVNELRLVTSSEKFTWLNEALALLKNKLNLNNVEYFVSSEQDISIVSGTAEYQLPDDFSDLLYIHDGSDAKEKIPFLRIDEIGSYDGNVTHYYLRNRYIGFVPTPSGSATYKYRYRAKASTVTGLSTYLDLPDNAFYALKDFMMYRASLKFNNPIANTYYESFTNSVNQFIQASVKRDAHRDSWDIADEANV
jgi:hypothetical protein